MSVAIIRHIPNNTLGNLEGVLDRLHIPFHYLEAQDLQPHHVALTDIQGIIILGGMESVAEASHPAFMLQEQKLLQNAIQANRPILGICLGSQILARTLGAKVERNQIKGIETREAGWHPLRLTVAGRADPVLSLLDGVKQFQWHTDTFQVPPQCTLLAKSDLCPRQAFRLEKQGAPVYGLQFHPEISLATIEQWLSQSRTMPDTEKQAILAESKQHFQVYEAASLKMFEAFCNRAF